MRKLLYAILVMALFLTGCDDSNYRKAVRAAAGVSSGLKALQDANEKCLLAGEYDQDAARAIAIGVGDAADLNGQIVVQLQSVKSLDAQSVAAIGALVAGLTQSVEKLQENGALHIKSDASKAKFNAAMAAIRASVDIMNQLLVGAR